MQAFGTFGFSIFRGIVRAIGVAGVTGPVRADYAEGWAREAAEPSRSPPGRVFGKRRTVLLFPSRVRFITPSFARWNFARWTFARWTIEISIAIWWSTDA